MFNYNLNLKSQIVTSNDNLNLRFQFVTSKKWDSLRSQNATIEDKRGQHRKYLTHAFFELGECIIPMHICKEMHKKVIELCISTEGMHRYCACFTGDTQNNSFEFDGFGKHLYFNYGIFTTIKSQVVLSRFTLTPKQWIKKSQQTVGQISSQTLLLLEKPIAKQAATQLTQISWGHN